MRYMLDTNILIYLMKNKPPQVAERVNALGSDAELCMSFFTFAELLMGAERSTQKADVLRRLDALARVVPVRYGVNRAICEHYAVQFTRLRAAGTPIGANDLWIASHALADDCKLVTNNTREFERVAGLRLENWAQSAGLAPMA
ncbi:MAG: type II toxin-antitoxin system VapC family toxin [Pseudomonadota bacterium]|nr:type II toxin-antitoxin system VapC family toxin [Pseudomonadota bacterium]